MLSVMPGCGNAESGNAPYDIDTLQPGERALVTLPLEFDIVSSNRLYVDGVLVKHALLTTEDGGSLFLNGTPILPHRPCPEGPPLPEETYERVYGAVPYVQELVESGASAREAGQAYLAAKRRVVGRLHELYLAARESGKDRDAAGTVAFDALRDLDEASLIDWDGEVTQSYNMFIVTWRGMRGEEEILFVDSGPERLQAPSEEAKQRLATRLYELLGRGGAPCWYVITCSSTSIDIGTEAVAKTQAHLDEARQTGVIEGGALSKLAVEQILANEGR